MTKDVYNQLLNIPAKEFEGNLYKQLLSQGANADMKFMESLRQTEWEQALEVCSVIRLHKLYMLCSVMHGTFCDSYPSIVDRLASGCAETCVWQ